MRQVTTNKLSHDGMRQVKIIGDSAFAADDAVTALWQYGIQVPELSVAKMQVEAAADADLGLFSLDVTWAVYGPWEVQYLSPKKFRRFMFVHYLYAERVSTCIEMAWEQFFIRTHFAPRDAYVAELSKGMAMGMDVHGCILQAAEWMPARCVAVGGMA